MTSTSCLHGEVHEREGGILRALDARRHGAGVLLREEALGNRTMTTTLSAMVRARTMSMRRRIVEHPAQSDPR